MNSNGPWRLTLESPLVIFFFLGINCSLAEAEAMVQQVDADSKHTLVDFEV